MSTASACFITPDALLSHWQAHRRLTRRVIDAFPEDKLFTFSIGGMRTFGELSLELLTMALPMARGIATSEWDQSFDRTPRPKAEILRAWDEDTPRIDASWKTIPAEKFHETAMATMRFIIAPRATSICARSASSRRPSTTAAEPVRPQQRNS